MGIHPSNKMVSIAQLIFCFLLVLALAYFLAQYAWRWVIRYRITKSHFEILAFGFPLFKTAVTDILEVRKVPFRELLPWNNRESIGWCRFGNRLSGECILVVRRKGLLNSFIITPDDPDTFLRTLTTRSPS